MSWEVDLQTGIAEYLDEQGVVDFAPDVSVTDLTRPLVIGPVPDQPDLCMGLLLYGGTPDPSQADFIQPAQFWMRAVDRQDAIDWGGELFDALHGLEDHLFGTVTCTLALCKRKAIPLPRDTKGRWEFADNYELLVMRAAPLFTD